MTNYLELYDYRCRVARMYRQRTQAILDGEDPTGVWRRFCVARDELFAHHPQSALDEEQKRNFQHRIVTAYQTTGNVLHIGTKTGRGNIHA